MDRVGQEACCFSRFSTNDTVDNSVRWRRHQRPQVDPRSHHITLNSASLRATAAPSPAHRRDTLASTVAASARAYYSSSQRPRTPISHSLLTPPQSSHFAQPISAPVARRRRRTRAPQGGGRRARAPQGGVATSMHVRWRKRQRRWSRILWSCARCRWPGLAGAREGRGCGRKEKSQGLNDEPSRNVTT